jgi:diaminohydroxyphosphoribosylaminopyrimidine deaminase/5-amino-6-(5-phosphoribosylamino)uracil reductase
MNDAATAEPSPAAPLPAALDERFMSMALALGRRSLGTTWPNPAVGAVIVKDGVIVGRGWTQPGGRPHAETQALKRAGKAAQGATLYVSLEPCAHKGKTPPCADAIIKAGIARVVMPMDDPNPEVAGEGHRKLTARNIRVDIGLFADAARRMHAGHIRRVSDGRPHVTLKLAVSSDGKAGLAGRRTAVITGVAARQRVFGMRAEADAILVGIGTVLADNPALTCRLPGMFERSPVRIVLDSQLRVPIASHVIATVRETPTLVFASHTASAMAEQVLHECGVKVFRVASVNGRLDLTAILKSVAAQGITRLMVEGGPTVAASFFTADLVDELALFRSDNIIGSDGIDAVAGMPLDAIISSPRFRALASELIGPDRADYFERC